MTPERCGCGHFPVMHAGGRGKCNHGSHTPGKNGDTGCDCTGFRAQLVIDTNDVQFASESESIEQGTLLGVVDGANDDY